MTTHALKLKKPLAFFDLETTGISITKDRILEIAILKAFPDGTTDSFCTRINPLMPIPLESSLIHGIYEADVAEAPTFAQASTQIIAFIGDADLAGFNICRFDVPMLLEAIYRLDIEFDISNRNLVDAQKIFHLMEPRNLSAAFRFYCNKDIETLGGKAHDAAIDTLATFHIFCEQIKRYENKAIKNQNGKPYIPVTDDMADIHKLSCSNLIDLAGRLAKNTNGEQVFNFGKHKDKIIAEVFKKEPAYYDWMMNGDFPTETKRWLTQIKNEKCMAESKLNHGILINTMI